MAPALQGISTSSIHNATIPCPPPLPKKRKKVPKKSPPMCRSSPSTQPTPSRVPKRRERSRTNRSNAMACEREKGAIPVPPIKFSVVPPYLYFVSAPRTGAVAGNSTVRAATSASLWALPANRGPGAPSAFCVWAKFPVSALGPDKASTSVGLSAVLCCAWIGLP